MVYLALGSWAVFYKKPKCILPRQIDRQIERQIYRYGIFSHRFMGSFLQKAKIYSSKVDRQIDRKKDIQICYVQPQDHGQFSIESQNAFFKGRQIYIQMDRKIYRWIESYINRQIDIQIDRKKDIQLCLAHLGSWAVAKMYSSKVDRMIYRQIETYVDGQKDI